MKFAPFASLLFLAGLTVLAQVPPQSQGVPVFRSGTDVVPLTVTVLDQKGAPVKDLKASDFTITENKKVREIVAFFPQELVPRPVPAADTPPARTRNGGLKPQSRRVFLIVLAYGRIEHPTSALEGAIALVNRLLPQDLVAVMAFHRTTALTTDHQRIVQLLERYRKDHEKIVLDINHYRLMATAPGVSGTAQIPDKILQRIDDIFLGSADVKAASSFLRNTADLLIRMDRVTPVVEKRGQYQETFGMISKILRWTGQTINDEVILNTKLKFYAGVEYLREIEGDKQMVFFSGLEGGGTLAALPYRPDGRGGMTVTMNRTASGGIGRDVDDARVIAQRASDARVVVNLIATNGTARRGGGGDVPGREVAELTGGYYTSLEMATKAAAKVAETSRFSYLLGYTPSNPNLDGTFRDVAVTVNRPGVTVRYRHGYFAAPEPPPLELEKLIKKSRIETALAYDQQATDIPLRVTVLPLPPPGIQYEMRVEIVIDAGPLSLALQDGLRTGQLEVQVYCGDAKQTVIGNAGQHFDLSVPEETYQQWLQTGIRRTIRVPTSAPPKYVKVVVYDYGSDRIGTAMVVVK
jgi:VWFA-related protein